MSDMHKDEETSIEEALKASEKRDSLRNMNASETPLRAPQVIGAAKSAPKDDEDKANAKTSEPEKSEEIKSDEEACKEVKKDTVAEQAAKENADKEKETKEDEEAKEKEDVEAEEEADAETELEEDTEEESEEGNDTEEESEEEGNDTEEERQNLKRDEDEIKAQREWEKQRIREEKKRAKAEKKAAKKEAATKRKIEKKKRHEENMRRPEYRRMRRFLHITAAILILIILIFVAVFLIKRYVRFSNYNVVSNINMTNVDEHTQVYKFHNGYIKCAGDGITYFDKGGMIWSESLSMAEPLIDVCGEYIAVTDMKSTEVFIFGTGGLINKISLTRNAINVEVSKYGSVAVVTNEGEANYIEIKDQAGNELVNVKTVFSSTGYLSDISLSPDGTKLAAAFISVADGSFGSKVIFYDFTKDSIDGSDAITGQFEQYEEMIVTSVEYMKSNKVVAVADSGFTVYSTGGTPEIVYEDLQFPWQIQSLFISDRYIGFIAENSEDDNPYAIKVFNTKGKLVYEQPFAFAYNKVEFAGTNIVLYSDYDCDVYNFAGTHKFSHTFDNRIYALKPLDDGVNYILLNSGQTQFIKLR